jgi:hypothetical protein
VLPCATSGATRTRGAYFALGMGVNLGSAETISKCKKLTIPKSGIRQDYAYWDFCREGEQRWPCLLSNFESHHLYMETSILQYSQHMDQSCQLPNWTNAFGEWITTLKEKGLLKWQLLRGKKERSYDAHLVFFALPTNLYPMADSCKVPSWNQWDPTLYLLSPPTISIAAGLVVVLGCLLLSRCVHFNLEEQIFLAIGYQVRFS